MATSQQWQAVPAVWSQNARLVHLARKFKIYWFKPLTDYGKNSRLGQVSKTRFVC